VRGELWSAVAEEGVIPMGEEVRVVGVEGVTLKVTGARNPGNKTIIAEGGKVRCLPRGAT
jgi:hypothetical protein